MQHRRTLGIAFSSYGVHEGHELLRETNTLLWETVLGTCQS